MDQEMLILRFPHQAVFSPQMIAFKLHVGISFSCGAVGAYEGQVRFFRFSPASLKTTGSDADVTDDRVNHSECEVQSGSC